MASSHNDSKRERLELVGARLAKALGGETLQGEGAVPVHSLNNSVWRGDHVKSQQHAPADAGAMPLEVAGSPFSMSPISPGSANDNCASPPTGPFSKPAEPHVVPSMTFFEDARRRLGEIESQLQGPSGAAGSAQTAGLVPAERTAISSPVTRITNSATLVTNSEPTHQPNPALPGHSSRSMLSRRVRAGTLDSSGNSGTLSPAEIIQELREQINSRDRTIHQLEAQVSEQLVRQKELVNAAEAECHKVILAHHDELQIAYAEQSALRKELSNRKLHNEAEVQLKLRVEELEGELEAERRNCAIAQQQLEIERSSLDYAMQKLGRSHFTLTAAQGGGAIESEMAQAVKNEDWLSEWRASLENPAMG